MRKRKIHVAFTGFFWVANALAIWAGCSGSGAVSISTFWDGGAGTASTAPSASGSSPATPSPSGSAETAPDASGSPSRPPSGAAAAPNIVFIIADDMGGADLDLYAGEWGNLSSGNVAHTPNIDALATAGMRFRNFYTNPICSPTRATLYTGKYGCETTVGDIITATQTADVLALSETTIARDVVTTDAGPAAISYVDALFGKWHLGETAPAGGLEAPVAQGWSLHVGVDEGDVPSFTNWTVRTTTAPTTTTTAATTTYATLKNYQDAIAFVTNTVGPSSATNNKRFILTMAFNAPHTPFHVPPNDPDGSKTYTNANVTSATDCTQTASARDCYLADEEALDFYVGRLITGLSSLGYSRTANTMFVFMSDNGSPSTGSTNVIYNSVLTNKGKDSAYEGGIREPLIVVGPRVAASNVGTYSDVLINSTDLFATFRDLVSGRTRSSSLSAKNSVSIVPYLDNSAADPTSSGSWAPRNWVYVDDFDGNAPYTETKSHEAIRDARYKYIVNYASSTKTYGLFDLSNIHQSIGTFEDWEADTLNLVDATTGALVTANPTLQTELTSLETTMAGIQAETVSALP